MSVINNAIMTVGLWDNRQVNEQVPGPAAAQATAVRLIGPLVRCTKSVSTGSFILPAIGSNEATEAVVVLNDSPNSINVYPASGEKTNGSANAAVAVAAGAAGVFIPSLGITNYPPALDWRSMVGT
jgi:hypothetical protein